MRKSVKIAIATAFAGLVAAGGAAFTATGINQTPSPTSSSAVRSPRPSRAPRSTTVIYGYEDASPDNVSTASTSRSPMTTPLVETATLTANGHGDGPLRPALLDVVLGDGTVVFHTALYPLGGYANLSTLNISVSAPSSHPLGRVPL